LAAKLIYVLIKTIRIPIPCRLTVHECAAIFKKFAALLELGKSVKEQFRSQGF